MDNAKRAAIASAFILPGAGLFLLKHYIRGCIFAIPATLVVGALCINLLGAAVKLNNEIAGRMPSIDLIMMLWNRLHTAMFESPYWDQGKWILLASWLLSIISSYYAGKKLDAQEAACKNTP